jgi:hypothetical protein
MRDKSFVKDLPDDHQIVAEWTTRGGEITKFCVRLQYQGRCICRYDTSHGFPHQDILRKGHGLLDWLTGKEYLLNKVDCRYIGDNQKVFEYALSDFSQDYERYSRLFESSG